MRAIRIMPALLASSMLSAASMSQENAPAPQDGGPPAADEPAAGAEREARPPVDDDVFIPSEEISADEEVIFPVDI